MAELTLNINDEVVNIIESRGYTTTQFFRRLLDYIMEFKALPAPLEIDNEDNGYRLVPTQATALAIEEIMNNRKKRTLKEYDSWDEAVKDIMAES